jgi:hypothetical protein
MRKFSVLLIVVLFFIPVFVYGLTGSSLTKPIGLVSSIRKFAPVANMLSLGQKEVVKPLAQIPLQPDDPFFPAPSGIRGIITEINRDEKMIFVKDAIYFNEPLQVFERADFKIYTDLATDVYINMEPVGTFDNLQVGEEIISKGPINLADKTSRYSVAIYKGLFVFPEEKRMVEFVGVITEFDRASMSFVVPGVQRLKMSLNEQTKCFQVTRQEQNEVVSFLDFHIMPDWVKNGTLIRGTMFVTPNATEYFADNIYFIKE